jgi:hypothetical protein
VTAQTDRPAPRILDPIKNDPAELERLLQMVEHALEGLRSSWEMNRSPPPGWAQRLASLCRRVRTDVPGTAARGLPVRGSLDEFVDADTRARWRDSRLPESEASCIRYGDNLCYYLHRECGCYLNDPETIRRLTQRAELALDRAMKEPGSKYIRAAELRRTYTRIVNDAERIAGYGPSDLPLSMKSYFDPALDTYLNDLYEPVERLECPESRAWLDAASLFAYIEAYCGLHLNNRAVLVGLLDAAQEALDRVPAAERVPYLVDLYEGVRLDLDAAVESGRGDPGPIARALDGVDDQVVSTAIDLTYYLWRCQGRPGHRTAR